MMPIGKMLQSFRHLWENLHWVIGHGMRETLNSCMQLRCDGFDRKPLKRIDQRVREAVQTVAVLYDALPLHIVKNLAHLLGRVFLMVQERNEPCNRTLEIDIVLPERVIGIDEQSLRVI